MAGRGRIENLRPPWKPSESGNISGRPRKRPISDRYEARIEEKLPDETRIKLKLPKDATFGDAIALAQASAALRGRTEAAREIREAIEGKATPRFELGSEGEPGITINIRRVE